MRVIEGGVCDEGEDMAVVHGSWPDRLRTRYGNCIEHGVMGALKEAYGPEYTGIMNRRQGPVVVQWHCGREIELNMQNSKAGQKPGIKHATVGIISI